MDSQTVIIRYGLDKDPVQGLHQLPEALPHGSHSRPRTAARISLTSAASIAASASASAITTPRSPTTDPLVAISRYKYKIALPAPSLYGQFKNLQDPRRGARRR